MLGFDWAGAVLSFVPGMFIDKYTFMKGKFF
jgi:hypothetical protein